MLPIDQPSTSVRPSPSVSMSALVWSAIASIVSGAGRLSDLPMPALSSVMTWWCWATASTNCGAQLSIVPP